MIRTCADVHLFIEPSFPVCCRPLLPGRRRGTRRGGDPHLRPVWGADNPGRFPLVKPRGFLLGGKTQSAIPPGKTDKELLCTKWGVVSFPQERPTALQFEFQLATFQPAIDCEKTSACRA